KNEGIYLKEWICFHARGGVAKFLLYDNGSSDHTSSEIAALCRWLDIEMIPWKNRLTWIHTQRAAYTDGLRRLESIAEFVAFIDVDEFIYSPEGFTLPHVLARFSNEVAAIGVNQLIFGSSGQQHYVDAPVVSRFTRRAPLSHPESKGYKSIVR